MIISDISYLESVSEASSIVGGRNRTGSKTTATSNFKNKVTVRQTARGQAQLTGSNGLAVAVPVNVSLLANVINQSGNSGAQGGDL